MASDEVKPPGPELQNLLRKLAHARARMCVCVCVCVCVNNNSWKLFSASSKKQHAENLSSNNFPRCKRLYQKTENAKLFHKIDSFLKNSRGERDLTL